MTAVADPDPSGPILPTARGAPVDIPATGCVIVGGVVQAVCPAASVNVKPVISVFSPIPEPLFVSAIVHARAFEAPVLLVTAAVSRGAIGAKFAVTVTGAFIQGNGQLDYSTTLSAIIP